MENGRGSLGRSAEEMQRETIERIFEDLEQAGKVDLVQDPEAIRLPIA